VIENSELSAGNEDIEEGQVEKKESKKKKKGNAAKGKSKKEDDQEFLMKSVIIPSLLESLLNFLSYILNRGWIDKSARRLPTYKEIVKPKSTKEKAKDYLVGSESEAPDEEQGDTSDGKQRAHDHIIEDDDEFEDIVDAFESSYNFRFEEP